MASSRQIIEAFLAEHGRDYFTCALATCVDDQPRNTPVDCRHDGLDMFFIADQGGKLDNLRRNPRVCLAVFMPVGRGYMRNARGLQMWGRARILTAADDPALFARGAQALQLDEISRQSFGQPLAEEVKRQLTMVMVTPDRIVYFDATGDQPLRLQWQAMGDS